MSISPAQMIRRDLEEVRQTAALVGTDEQYLAWLRTQPSFISGKFSEWLHGEGRNPSCHVRRSVHSGIACKPIYSAVPMTNEEHADQSNKGEAYCLGRHTAKYPWTKEEAKLFFDNAAIVHLIRWIRTIT